MKNVESDPTLRDIAGFYVGFVVGIVGAAIASVMVALFSLGVIILGLMCVAFGLAMLFVAWFGMACLHICGVDIRSWIDARLYGMK